MSYYVLDGIKTAMEVQNDEFQVRAKCACGAEWFNTTRDLHEQRASLRFHYTHCPQAKVVRTERAARDKVVV